MYSTFIVTVPKKPEGELPTDAESGGRTRGSMCIVAAQEPVDVPADAQYSGPIYGKGSPYYCVIA
jgi:hypothetical protein